MFYKVILSILVMILFANQALANDTKKVLIVLTSHDQLGSTGKKTGFWLPELTHPYYRLTQANIDVDIASIKGGLAPIDAKAFTEADDNHQRFLNDTDLLTKVLNTIPIDKVVANEYDAVIYSGGSGPMWDFPNNPDIERISTTIYQNNGIVAAVCHGVAALTSITLPNGDLLIKGKRVTGFSNIEEQELGTENIVPFLLQSKLIDQGATFIEGKPWQSNVIIDGQLITGQNPASATPLADALINQLRKN
ncbi:type 1 glutamine amidotransferase domain-containing protein [Thalassotalea sp. PP2-459]|uniref:type 1 glutamine amidotransferase domain-containing protein n=1 Tax=Thalassotalea sp. PP2-459 TaxID=1742724 RepID=UPI000942F307|nr:type 1 glutamine amidotransferase domain-containing protein [Thalassotalea sp. PP2-459]